MTSLLENIAEDDVKFGRKALGFDAEPAEIEVSEMKEIT